MKQIHRLDLPTVRKSGSDRILTMNLYRNAHWSALAKAKRKYHEEVSKFAEQLPKFNKLSVHYILYFPDKRKRDIDNMTYALHKFLMDSLVEHKVIDDDDVHHVVGFSTYFGGIAEDKQCYAMVEFQEEEDDEDND